MYNAAPYLTKSVESALEQAETKEVILIEDGSTDSSLEICKKLEANYDKVQLFTHPGNGNQGAGLSRNVGIQKASGEFIAFLDADDFYLPNRFRAEQKVFLEKPQTEGVYGALGFHYHTEQGRKKFQDYGFETLTTISGPVSPQELLPALLWLHKSVYGHFHLDTLTLKRSAFLRKGELFNNLVMHEDTVFIIQLSLNCILEPGIISKAVALRGGHDNNRITNNTLDSGSRLRMWQCLYNWSKGKRKDKEVISLFEAFLVTEKILHSKRLWSFLIFLKHVISNDIFLKKTKFFNPSCKKVFGKKFSVYIIDVKNRIQFEISKKGKMAKFFNRYFHKTASTNKNHF